MMALRFYGRTVLACAALVATPLACLVGQEPASYDDGDGSEPGAEAQPEAEPPLCDGPMGPPVDPATTSSPPLSRTIAPTVSARFSTAISPARAALKRS